MPEMEKNKERFLVFEFVSQNRCKYFTKTS